MSHQFDIPAREWPIRVSDDIDVMVTLNSDGSLAIDASIRGEFPHVAITLNDTVVF